MSYRAGTIGLGGYGVPDNYPRIICDGCGHTERADLPRRGVYGPPPMPFKRGWSGKYNDDGRTRHDMCPACKKAAKAKP